MTYKGIFIDDQEVVFAETLSSPHLLKFHPHDVGEVASLARKIINEKPIIVAIDYRLDEAPVGIEFDQTYKGSALAQHLRDASIEHPKQDFALVLVSAESKIKTLYRPDKTAHDLFDRVYVKEDINRDRASIRRELICLCIAYEKLRSTGNKYDIVDLMAGMESDRPYIDVQEIRNKLSDAAAPHIAARIIFNIIDHPGPLLDTADACAYLGIEPGDGQDISELLTEAGIAYKGLFSEAWPRWWTNRLEDWAQSIFKRRSTGLPSVERARLLSESSRRIFKPALSPWNKSPDELISFACASCRRGTELRHSVAVFESVQSRYKNRRRVCWDCVQTDQYEVAEPPLLIDETDQDLVSKVKSLDRTEDQLGGGA